MTGESLAMLFGVSYQVLRVNVMDLTHEESLLQPGPGGNCLNWVMGHVVATRSQALQLLGEQPVWTEAQIALYKRGSRPITDAARAERLETILADLDRSQEPLISALCRITPELLAAQGADGTLAEKLAMMHFHEAYHAGQTGLLRRLLGKEGTIR